MWNPFKKKNYANDPNQMGMLQRLAMKKVMSMSQEERTKLLQKFMSPENIEKNQDKIKTAILRMKKAGQITEAQAEEAKKQLGL